MRIDSNKLRTGHRSFDAKIDYVGTGNVISNVQHSAFIRAASNTWCNGFSWSPGVLRDADLKSFRQLPHHIRRRILEATQDEQAILYMFRHRQVDRQADREVVHGYVLTRDQEGQYERLGHWVTGPTAKSHDIIETMMQAVSTPPGTTEHLRATVIPAQLAAMDDHVARQADGALRNTVMEIARIIGGDPDLGATTPDFNGRGEARNVLRALIARDTIAHFRFSIAGEEALKAACAVADQHMAGQGAFAREAEFGLKMTLDGLLKIAGDHETYGHVDEAWTIQAFAAKAAGRDLDASGPTPR